MGMNFMGFLLGIMNDGKNNSWDDSTSANEKVSRPTVAAVHPKAAGGPLVPFGAAPDRAGLGALVSSNMTG